MAPIAEVAKKNSTVSIIFGKYAAIISFFLILFFFKKFIILLVDWYNSFQDLFIL